MKLLRESILLVVCIVWSVDRLPAATYFVSPAGDDASNGTRGTPLKTISAAANKAVAGDTVLVLEGVYRERVAPPRGGVKGKPIIYRGESGKRVVVKGSEVWQPNWNSEGAGIYSAHPDDSLFDDRSSQYVDHYNPFKVELSSTPWHREGKREHERGFGGDEELTYTCGQVFVDGKPLREVPFRRELEPNTWWYDAKRELVFVHFGERDPAECEVELTTRRRIFAPENRGLGHIVVEGFVFEHCGNQYPTNFWNNDANAQRGAVGTEAGHNWIIRRNVIRYAKTFALDVGRVNIHSNEKSAYDNLVEENYIIDNGSAGIMSCGSRNLVIRNNVVLRNNRLHFLGKKRWEHAGIKCHWLRDGHIEGNCIAHNYDTYGIWLDNQFPDSRISSNVIHDNGRAGIFLEMSDYDFDRLLVDNNFILDNHENAVYIHDASGATFVNNLLANTHETKGYGQAVYIRQVGPRTRTGNHSFFGNLFIGNARNIEVDFPAFRSGVQRFDYNLYDASSQAKSFVVNGDSDVPSPWSDDEFRDLILNDLGLTSKPKSLLTQPGKAAMAFGQWKQFWQQHDELNDANSRCETGSSVSYESSTYELTIELSADPPEFPEERDTATELVLSKLHRGKNKLEIWHGLPILDPHELPPAKWTE
jgi:parallel beta-helix repeat protein